MRTPQRERQDLAIQPGMKPFGVGLGLGLAGLVVLFPEARKFVPIESRPARLQAVEKFEVAAGEYRHDNAKCNCAICSAISVLANEPRRRRNVGTVGKYGAGEHALFDPQMIPQQALEQGAQIGRRFEVAHFIELGRLQSRPVGDPSRRPEAARWNLCVSGRYRSVPRTGLRGDGGPLH
jgi:hypothetical protein